MPLPLVLRGAVSPLPRAQGAQPLPLTRRPQHPELRAEPPLGTCGTSGRQQRALPRPGFPLKKSISQASGNCEAVGLETNAGSSSPRALKEPPDRGSRGPHEETI